MRYRDSDGDIWERQTSGAYDLVEFCNGTRPTSDYHKGWSWFRLSSDLGPMVPLDTDPVPADVMKAVDHLSAVRSKLIADGWSEAGAEAVLIAAMGGPARA